MFLTNLTLSNFRSYHHVETEIPRGILLLSGGNAQGKTTILEALFYCAAFSSQLAENDRQLIRFEELKEPVAVARIVAQFQKSNTEHKLEIRIIQETANFNTRVRKEILLNGIKTSAQKAIGTFPAVLLIPQMTAILEGSPQERRRYLNLTLSQSIPGYAQALTEYNQIISQRNALLKLISERKADPQQLDYWDDLMAKRASFIIYHRIHALLKLEEFAQDAHLRLTANQEKLCLNYQPSYDPAKDSTGNEPSKYVMSNCPDRSSFSTDEIEKGFHHRLNSIRNKEIERGLSTIGPHRDDFRINGNEIDLGTYGSRGQIRTALISLKLAEINWMQTKTGVYPLLLLDETLAELDHQRRNDLQEWLNTCNQGILTTSDLSHFTESFIQKHVVWNVTGGTIQK